MDTVPSGYRARLCFARRILLLHDSGSQHKCKKVPSAAARGFSVFRKSLLAPSAISIHRSGLEAALPEPLEDLVFREADLRS
jgi:hypothetical protein